MINSVKRFGVAVLVIFLTGCASGMGSKVDAAINGDPKYNRLVVIHDHCDFHRKAKASSISAILLSGLISSAVKGLGAMLKKAGDSSTATSSTSRAVETDPERPSKCLVVAKGLWEENPTKPFMLNSKPVKVQVEDKTFKLLENPEFLFSANVKLSSDLSSLKLVPDTLVYDSQLGSTSKATRGLAVHFSFHDAGKAADADEAQKVTLVLGDFKPGDTDIKDNPMRFKTIESSWFGDYTNKVSAKSKFPINITASVIETKRARPFLQFLAGAFSGSQEALEAELQTQLIKSKSDEAKAVSSKANHDLFVAMQSAKADAEISIQTYCALASGADSASKLKYLTSRKDIFVKQSTANLSAATAGYPEPYQSVVDIDSTSPQSSALCS